MFIQNVMRRTLSNPCFLLLTMITLVYRNRLWWTSTNDLVQHRLLLQHIVIYNIQLIVFMINHTTAGNHALKHKCFNGTFSNCRSLYSSLYEVYMNPRYPQWAIIVPVVTIIYITRSLLGLHLCPMRIMCFRSIFFSHNSIASFSFHNYRINIIYSYGSNDKSKLQHQIQLE
jgi:hypothetical protein